jgi:hypothetical protein
MSRTYTTAFNAEALLAIQLTNKIVNPEILLGPELFFS